MLKAVITILGIALIAILGRHMFYKWLSAEMNKGIIHMIALFLAMFAVAMAVTSFLVYLVGGAALGAVIGGFYATLAYFDVSPSTMVLISIGLGATAGIFLLRSNLKAA